jgi:hypothetical protein
VADVDHAAARDVVAPVENPAARGLRVAGEHVEQRRLSGAVRADDREQLALAHLEREIGQGSELAVALGDVADFEQHCAGSPRGPRLGGRRGGGRKCRSRPIGRRNVLMQS